MSKEKPFEAMDSAFEMLEERVLDCLTMENISKVMEQLSAIDGATLITGSGGSSVSAHFIARVLSEKNGIICDQKLPDEIWHMNLRPYKDVIAVSSSGANAGVDKAFRYAKEFGITGKLLTSSDKFDKNVNLVYGTSLKKEDSFISFANTLMPMAVALCYYIGDVEETYAVIAEMFEKARNNIPQVKDGKIYEVIGKESYPTAAAFIDSCLNESSIATPVTSGKYDECHGRTTSVLNQEDRQMLYFMDKKSELDEFFHERLAQVGIADKITDVNNNEFDDIILGDFYLTLVSVYWCRDLAKKKGVDLTSMTNLEGQRIHLPAYGPAIEAWEQEHAKQFWEGRPDWAGLNKASVDAEEKTPGYYGPTGKFLKEDKENQSFGPTGIKI